MPKIIVKIKHLKVSKKVGGLIDYVAKREGVDKTVNEQISVGKPTEKQLEFIDKMLSECPDVKKSFEYEDYIEKLSCYMAGKKKSYDNHYATIVKWITEDNSKQGKRAETPGNNIFLQIASEEGIV